MFDHPGRKIKGLANFLLWAGFIISGIIGGMLLFVGGSDTTLSYAGMQVARGPGWLTGSLFVILGCASSWVCSLLLYALGDLVEKTSENNALLKDLARREEQ